MKYIKKITLENFQSHKYSTIEFDDRLNVIVGPSDSGKSAIIRGLKWALYNEPQGDYFIREGEKECSVTLEFNDKTILKRYRSKSKNSYILTKNNGEEVKYEGFGVNVPDEIIEEIGIKKIYLDSELSNSINIGEQLEGAFLLSEKNSTKAGAIGRLVGVNIIDDALREALKDTRALNTTRKVLEENVSRLSDEIQTYDYLDELKNRANKVIGIKALIDQQNTKLQKLIYVKDKLEEGNIEINKTAELLDSLKNVDILNSQVNKIESKVLKHNYLNNYRNTLVKVKRELCENNIVLTKLSNIQYAAQMLEQLNTDYSRYNRIMALSYKYRQILAETNKLSASISRLTSIDKADDYIIDATTKINQYIKLNEKKLRLISISSSLNAGRIYIMKLAHITSLENITVKLENKLNLLRKCNKLYNELLKNKDEMVYQIESISKINEEIDREVSKYQKLLEKIEICPFCLSSIDEDKIDHIINHYIGG